MKKALAVVLLLTLAGAVLAHEGEHHIMGKVTTIGENSITVETAGKEPKKVTVWITSETKIQKDGSPATLKDLRIGERVVIHAKEKDKKLEASLVAFGKPGEKK